MPHRLLLTLAMIVDSILWFTLGFLASQALGAL
jgi:hypothetical protein